MSVLQWDKSGERLWTVGVHNTVLFVSNPNKINGYDDGIAWEGVSKITESPEGAEATDIWANDGKYGTIRSSEQFKGTIEAYTSPVEFDACDGCATPAPGFVIHQQNRKPFALCWMDTVGNDTSGADYSEVLHIVYNATAKPSSVDHETVNDSPSINPLSWEFETTPVAVEGYKPSSHFEFRKKDMQPSDWTALLGYLHGTNNSNSTLPTPNALLGTFGGAYTYTALTTEPDDWETKYYEKYYTKYGTFYTLIPRQDSAPTFVANQYYERGATT